MIGRIPAYTKSFTQLFRAYEVAIVFEHNDTPPLKVLYHYVRDVKSSSTGIFEPVETAIVFVGEPVSDYTEAPDYIEIVRTGYLGDYFDVTVEEVLESANGRWDIGMTISR
jgi:hypothetical protein